MRTFNKCELIISAPDQNSWPEHDLKEVVLAGRSNVGKSSFINTITNRKKLAYVGNTPGKTRLLNFFNINDEFCLVDVPGYGYANISQKQLIEFGEMMEDYFHNRENKVGLVMIVDGRHKPSEDDLVMIDFARYYHINVIVVATKMDKVKNSQRSKNLKVISEELEVPMQNIIPFSSETREGVVEAQQAIFNLVER